jgi:D-cysteine desulfhydrase
MNRIIDKINSVKKLDIGCFPTPIHRLQNIEKELRYEKIFIKRDDLTGIGPGGNKIRSLEYILMEAKVGGADTILVSGPLNSNLCTITACVCKKMNIDCISVVNSNKPIELKGNLLLDKLLKLDSLYIGNVTEEERGEYVEDLYRKLQEEGRKPYIIKYGASSGIGAMGYVNAIIELQEQCSELNMKIDEIFAPGANGGVAAGLIYGNMVFDFPFNINIISVEYENGLLEQNINRIIKEIEVITDVPFNFKLKDVCNIVDNYKGKGWGVKTSESEKMVFDFPRKEGVFVENIYTSKVLVGMFDFIRSKKIKGNACFIHTGGFSSLFGQF